MAVATSPIEATVGFVVVLLFAALIVGIVARNLRAPYAILLLLVSLPLNLHGAISFGPILLFIFLPALIFEAAWQLDFATVRRYAAPIAVLAIPGVLVTMATIAAAAVAFGHLPWIEALLLGAILSATDPIAVIAAFRSLAGVPSELETIVEGESLLNDGIAAAAYGVLSLAALTTQLPAPSAVLGSLVVGSAGGALVGAVVAFGLALVIRFARDVQLDIVATLVGAYGSYLLAERLGASGIFAALTVGVALRALPRFPSGDGAVEGVDRFWGVLAFIANALVFLLLGLRIDVSRIFHEPALIAATLVALVVSRIAIAYVGLPLVGIRGERAAWNHVVVIAGMRGALSLALALAMPAQTPYRAQIIDAVFFAVTVTLVVQGFAIGPVIRRLRLS